MDKSQFKCPLCESLLSREKYILITGQWKEIEANKSEMAKLKKEKQILERRYQTELKKIAKEREAQGLARGLKKGNELLQKRTKELDQAYKKIQELDKQLKEGKTPQVAGFDYEKDVEKILKETFPDDEIKSTGKLGDNIQTVKFQNQIAGSIIYECKKTASYNNSFVLEILRHQETAGCNYAVIVTHASKEGKSKFFIDRGVIIIDPFGFLDVALLLRNAIIEMHQLKLTKEQIGEKSKEILKYMQSGNFRNHMLTAIAKSEEAYNLLKDEMNGHVKVWKKRYEIYSSIHANVQAVRLDIGKIITGGELPQAKEFPNPLIAITPTINP